MIALPTIACAQHKKAHWGLIAVMVCGVLLTGCSKKADVQQTEAASPDASATSDVNNENSAYIQKMDQDVAISDPNDLIDSVHRSVGDNSANAEKARRMAEDGNAAEPLPVPHVTTDTKNSSKNQTRASAKAEG